MLQQEVLAHESAERLLRYFEPRALESIEAYCHVRDLMGTFLTRLEESYRANAAAIAETTPAASSFSGAGVCQVQPHQTTGENTVRVTGARHGEQRTDVEIRSGVHPGYRTC